MRYALLPDDDGEISFFLLEDMGVMRDLGLSPRGNAREIDLPHGPRISAWAVPCYLDELQELADDKGLEPRNCARIFGTVDLPGRTPDTLWRYHWALGFRRF